LDDPDAVTVTTVLYDPAAKPLVDTLALMLSVSVVVVPLITLRPSQAAVSVSVHVKVPPVGFDTVIGLASGAGPPTMPEKLKLVGLSRMLGVTVAVEVAMALPPVTVKVTGTGVTCVLSFLSMLALRIVQL
jgi:hypothetical protein